MKKFISDGILNLFLIPIVALVIFFFCFSLLFFFLSQDLLTNRKENDYNNGFCTCLYDGISSVNPIFTYYNFKKNQEIMRLNGFVSSNEVFRLLTFVYRTYIHNLIYLLPNLLRYTNQHAIEKFERF